MQWRVTALILFSFGFAVACSSGGSTSKRTVTKADRARLYVSAANGALAQKDPTGALQSLYEAEKIDPSIPELYYLKSVAYFGKHDYGSAIDAASKALELNPKYSEAQNALGSLLIRTGKYDEAKTHLLAATQDPLFRDAYMAWTNLGIMSYRAGQYSQAKVYFDHAVLEAPEKACSAYYYRGQIYQINQRLSDAIEEYRRATKRFCARFGEAQMALGLAYEKKREYELARKTFLEIRQQFPDSKLADSAMDQLRFIP